MVQLNSTVYVHTAKLLNNVSAIKKRLNKNVQTMAVIKDNAYGHGLIETAKRLEPEVNWFCVARVDEGVSLRKAGIQLPILIFECPTDQTAVLFSDYNLTATLTDISTLELLKEGTEFQINLDTGMRRLGFLPDEVSELTEELKKYPNLTCTGIYTHFAKADDPGNPEVAKQLATFRELRAAFDSELLTHTANTGAIFHYQELDLQFDAVRPGVSLYGYGAGDKTIEDLQPAIEWKSFLMQVKPIKQGEAVSYGWRWNAPSDGFIAAVPTGYAAGISRLLGSAIEYSIEGQRYEQAGTVSMDYSMVFLRDKKFKPGTEITLLGGDALNASEWAKSGQTIPYEITTRIHPSIKRVFID